MGLDVAQRLDESGLWKVHILGTNQQRGEEAAAPLNNTTFHQVDVASYQEQATVLDKIFNDHHRLDFVFANAGKASNLINAFFAKHETDGMIGFTRSVGKELWEEGVKVNAICPGVVTTPLLTPEIKAMYAEKIRIPMSNVTDIVFKIISGNQVEDSKGVCVPGEELYSRVILIVGKKYYFVDHPEYFDEETHLTHQYMMVTQSEQGMRS
ncbi:uncharacterized protein N7483_010172 [Penicillium malachiteum]|uniref:uncharacterized protein n=1 Tax=Penicillium malachiteum TaxID=1324776 RepID=UPI002549949D|nr:uncharacterized protein N7483_010172 [Penicillium malachiteum]KAJ5712991.1 hypothetical protein N7483_010172 [Penicillium malachiteum]